MKKNRQRRNKLMRPKKFPMWAANFFNPQKAGGYMREDYTKMVYRNI